MIAKARCVCFRIILTDSLSLALFFVVVLTNQFITPSLHHSAHKVNGLVKLNAQLLEKAEALLDRARRKKKQKEEAKLKQQQQQLLRRVDLGGQSVSESVSWEVLAIAS